MLLNNLNVSDGCKVSFDSEVQTAPPSPETVPQNVSPRTGETSNSHADESEQAQKGEEPSEKEGASGEPLQGKIVEQEGDGENAEGISCEENGHVGNPEKEEGVIVAGAGESAAASGGMVDVSSLRTKLFDMCGDLSVSFFFFFFCAPVGVDFGKTGFVFSEFRCWACRGSSAVALVGAV